MNKEQLPRESKISAETLGKQPGKKREARSRYGSSLCKAGSLGELCAPGDASGPMLLHCEVNGGNAGERRRAQITEGAASQIEGVAGMRQGAFKNFMQTSDITRFVLLERSL